MNKLTCLLISLFSFFLVCPTLAYNPLTTPNAAKLIRAYIAYRKTMKKEIAAPQLTVKLTGLGLQQMSENHDLTNGKTGIKKLDKLNSLYGGYPVQYHNLTLALAFEKTGHVLQELADAYTSKGGKYWEVDYSSDTPHERKSKFVKQIWVQLTAAGAKKFKTHGDLQKQKSGIKRLDDLNQEHNGSITNTFPLEAGKLALIVTFERAVKESVLDQYRALSEVESVERDDE